MTSMTVFANLRYDPVEPLVGSGDAAVAYFARRDLVGEAAGDIRELWNLPLAKSIASRQQANGSWKYPGGNARIRSREDYDQIETFRQLGYLVEMYGGDRRHPSVAGAIEFLLGHQTTDGDIRGILGRQYAPYYTAAMTELMIKAGYAEDPRVKKVFDWLEMMRQDDGGWAMPLRTRGARLEVISDGSAPLEPNRAKPFSHLITGMVLRAYAAHPRYRHTQTARDAASLLAGRLFHRDAYSDRADPSFWTRFSYPFWFTDLISATDSLTRIGYDPSDPALRAATQWLVDRQQPNGLWELKALKNRREFRTQLWLSLAAARVLGRLS